jgi:transposase-like protein
MVRRSAHERARLVAAYHASNLTQEAFAHRHGINVGTLRGWLYRGEASAQVSFVEVAAAPETAAVVIELGHGVRVRFAEAPTATYLAELARALAC